MAQREITIRLEEELLAIYERASARSRASVPGVIEAAIRELAKDCRLALGHELSAFPCVYSAPVDRYPSDAVAAFLVTTIGPLVRPHIKRPKGSSTP